MNSLDPLRRELDTWASNGQVASLWWRDDDADSPTEAVRRMLDLSGDSGATVVVAVVPAKLDDALGPVLLDCPTAVAVQHGYAHKNHSPEDVRGKWELGLHRPLDTILGELRLGWTRLSGLFGSRVRPTLVPPWNRIDAGVVSELPKMGYTTLSTIEPRTSPQAAPGLNLINCHCDIIAWKRNRAFIGPEKTAQRLAEHLRARRLGEVDTDEPTGLLSHVWINDDETWVALAAVLSLVADHPGGRWLDRADLGL